MLDVLTPEHGRIAVLAKGARRIGKRGSDAARLQPFMPLLLSFSGRAELKTMTAVEPAGTLLRLIGGRLYSALYLNELLVRLLHRNDPHPGLFAEYGTSLEALSGSRDLEAVLRHFELVLLDELGYSFDFTIDGNSGEAVHVGGRYFYEPGSGMVMWRGGANQPALFEGAVLLAIARGEFDGEFRIAARRLLRQVLSFHLGGTPLRSRELFRSHRAKKPGGLAE